DLRCARSACPHPLDVAAPARWRKRTAGRPGGQPVASSAEARCVAFACKAPRSLRHLEICLRLAVFIDRMTVVLVTDVLEHFPGAVATEGVAQAPGLFEYVGIGEGEIQMQDVRVVLVEVETLFDDEVCAVVAAGFAEALAGTYVAGFDHEHVAFPVPAGITEILRFRLFGEGAAIGEDAAYHHVCFLHHCDLAGS